MTRRERPKRATNSGMQFSEEERLMKRIQPPIAVRQRVLDPRHAICFQECVPKADLSTIREALKKPKKSRKPCIADSSRMRKDRASSADDSEKKKTADDEGEKEDRDGAEQEGEGEEEGEGEIREDQDAVEETPKKSGRKSDAQKRKKKAKRKKEARKSDEDAECESVCSFDSDICLAGMTLTTEDKKKIQDNRRRIHSNGAAAEK